jgi:hypothetical protein
MAGSRLKEQANTQKVYLGDNKRESTLQHSYFASPRSDENQRYRNRVPSTNSQASFDRGRLNMKYQSVEESKSGVAPNQGQRSMRRIPEEPAEGGQVISFNNKLSTSKQQRISKKLLDRLNSQLAFTNEKMMDIREEFTGKEAQGVIDKLAPARSSIPVLSTKHFLEIGSTNRDQQS